jgi:ubiquinone/menaquinone biosynthesis C-methylase UbiE
VTDRPQDGVVLDDFVRAPNQSGRPELYEIENAALDRSSSVLNAMSALAPWRDRAIVDVGCGSGFWLPVYAREAATVIGVEPDDALLPRARARTGGARVLRGSAEHLPLPDNSVDVVHARFAYFFPPGCAAGLAEVRRVLRPGGQLVVVDNDYRHGQFAELLARSTWAAAQGTAETTDAWWAERGTRRTEVMSSWSFDSRADFENVLRMEFPPAVADGWLTQHPDALGLTYGYVLFSIGKSARPAKPG